MEFDQQNITSLKNPISRLAYTLAKITLRFNLFVNEFIELYKFHMVMLAKKQNPDHSIVELSARTGLDRRYVSETLKNEELKKTKSKVRLVLQQMRQVCKRKGTKFIAKHGKIDSFESICKQVSSGSLTNKAIASELLRLREIVDDGRKFEVVNPNGNLIHDEISITYATRRLLNELNIMCLKNDSNTIKKFGKENSLEYIFNAANFNNISSERIISELIRLGNIKDNIETYELINWKFFSDKDESYLILFSKELARLSDTVIENINNPIKDSKKLHRFIYSNQINPSNFSLLNEKLKQHFHELKDSLYTTFLEFEDNVPRGKYPTFGVSMFTFGPDHNKDYSK